MSTEAFPKNKHAEKNIQTILEKSFESFLTDANPYKKEIFSKISKLILTGSTEQAEKSLDAYNKIYKNIQNDDLELLHDIIKDFTEQHKNQIGKNTLEKTLPIKTETISKEVILKPEQSPVHTFESFTLGTLENTPITWNPIQIIEDESKKKKAIYKAEQLDVEVTLTGDSTEALQEELLSYLKKEQTKQSKLAYSQRKQEPKPLESYEPSEEYIAHTKEQEAIQDTRSEKLITHMLGLADPETVAKTKALLTVGKKFENDHTIYRITGEQENNLYPTEQISKTTGKKTSMAMKLETIADILLKENQITNNSMENSTTQNTNTEQLGKKSPVENTTFPSEPKYQGSATTEKIGDNAWKVTDSKGNVSYTNTLDSSIIRKQNSKNQTKSNTSPITKNTPESTITAKESLEPIKIGDAFKNEYGQTEIITRIDANFVYLKNESQNSTEFAEGIKEFDLLRKKGDMTLIQKEENITPKVQQVAPKEEPLDITKAYEQGSGNTDAWPGLKTVKEEIKKFKQNSLNQKAEAEKEKALETNDENQKTEAGDQILLKQGLTREVLEILTPEERKEFMTVLDDGSRRMFTVEDIDSFAPRIQEIQIQKIDQSIEKLDGELDGIRTDIGDMEKRLLEIQAKREKLLKKNYDELVELYPTFQQDIFESAQLIRQEKIENLKATKNESNEDEAKFIQEELEELEDTEKNIYHILSISEMKEQIEYQMGKFSLDEKGNEKEVALYLVNALTQIESRIHNSYDPIEKERNKTLKQKVLDIFLSNKGQEAVSTQEVAIEQDHSELDNSTVEDVILPEEDREQKEIEKSENLDTVENTPKETKDTDSAEIQLTTDSHENNEIRTDLDEAIQKRNEQLASDEIVTPMDLSTETPEPLSETSSEEDSYTAEVNRHWEKTKKWREQAIEDWTEELKKLKGIKNYFKRRELEKAIQNFKESLEAGAVQNENYNKNVESQKNNLN